MSTTTNSEPAATEWGHEIKYDRADALREAQIGDELIINDRKRPLSVRETTHTDDGAYGRRRLFLQGNGCDYSIEVDQFHDRAKFELLDTGRATDTRDLGTIEWVVEVDPHTSTDGDFERGFTSKTLDEDYNRTAVNRNTGTEHVMRPDHGYKTMCGMFTNWCRRRDEPWPLEEQSLWGPDMCTRCRRAILSESDHD